MVSQPYYTDRRWSYDHHDCCCCCYYFANRSGAESIVMSASVCLSVCLRVSESCLSVCPPGYLRNHTRYLCLIFVHVSYGRGSVLLRQGDEIPKERGCFRNFPHQWQCIVMRLLQITSISSRADHSVPAGERWDCTARTKCNLRLPCCYYCCGGTGGGFFINRMSSSSLWVYMQTVYHCKLWKIYGIRCWLHPVQYSSD